jgi:hypothetical protein
MSVVIVMLVTFTELHCITSQKTVAITAMRTTNFIVCIICS